MWHSSYPEGKTGSFRPYNTAAQPQIECIAILHCWSQQQNMLLAKCTLTLACCLPATHKNTQVYYTCFSLVGPYLSVQYGSLFWPAVLITTAELNGKTYLATHQISILSLKSKVAYNAGTQSVLLGVQSSLIIYSCNLVYLLQLALLVRLGTWTKDC